MSPDRLEQAGLNRRMDRASAALPIGWRLEGLTCASESLEPGQRSDRWRVLTIKSSRSR